MKIKLINGPLHGMEMEQEQDQPYYDFLEKSTGKVRRYAKSEMVYFVKEWANMEEYNNKDDNPTRPGQLGQDNVNPGDRGPIQG